MISEQQKQTICWECRKCTGGKGCPWADEFKPVKGWKAIRTVVKMFNRKNTDSYIVVKCPLFERGR